MAEDNVVINTLERASSSDLNTLQTLQHRLLSEFMGTAFAEVTADPHITPWNGGDIPRSACAGLKVYSDGANGITVQGGMLMQYSLTYPAVPALYETPYRLGINDDPTNLALPTPAGGAWYLIEARVIDVVTLTGVRDIFNPATKVFDPTSVPKIQQREIAFRVTTGTATSIPGPTANWVPIGYGFAPSSSPTPFDGTKYCDLRPCFLDGQDDRANPASIRDGTMDDFQLQTSTSVDASAAGYKVTGKVRGQCFNTRFRLEVLPFTTGLAVETEASWAAPVNTLVHLYLCPLYVGTGLPLYTPKAFNVGDPYQLTQGIVIVSTVAPTRMSRENSAAITLPVKYTNWNGGVVPANTALHIGSLATNSSGNNFEWMEQSSGGRVRVNPAATAFVGAASFGGTATAVVALDLRNKVPPNAKSVLLQWNGHVAGANAGDLGFVTIRRLSTNALGFLSIPNYGASLTNDTFGYIEIPTAAFLDLDTNLNLEVRVGLPASGVTGAFIQFNIAGWTF